MSFPQPTPYSLWLYEALQQGVVQLPLGERTQIVITGADRVNFLHGFCTGDIKKLQPGEGCEAFITNHQGKAAGHVIVLAEADRLILNGAAGQAEKLIAHLDRFVISEQVTFSDQSAETTHLLLGGKDAEGALQRMELVPPASRLQHAVYSLGKVPVLLTRVDFLGPTPAFLFSVAKTDATQLGIKLASAGAASSDNDTSAAVWQMARIEAGYPLYGQDISEDNLPQEVARDPQAINFNKGCYLGQETIARLDALGHVNRVLTGLKFPADAVVQPGETILQGDKKIAMITSLAWSPKSQVPLALAYVRSLHATPGKRIPFAGGEAEVVKLPLE
jgi:folate-binding protein YgfZ